MRQWVWGLVVALLMGGVGRTQAASLLYGSAYGPDVAARLYTINPATGDATLVGPIGFGLVGSLDFSPSSGILYGEGRRLSSGAHVLLTINPTTGAGTEVGPLGL